jgi:hypothetical protein
VLLAQRTLGVDERAARRASSRRWPNTRATFSPCDLVLVEGFKHEAIPRLEVYRPANGKPPLWPEQRQIVAVASDQAAPAGPAGRGPLAGPERRAGDRRFHPRSSSTHGGSRCCPLKKHLSACSRRHRRSPKSKSLPTLHADRRVLAQAQTATVDAPPLDNSAMDGYAVAVADVPAVGDLPAGDAAHSGRQRRQPAAAGQRCAHLHRRADPARR